MHADPHFEPILTKRLLLRRSRAGDAETISAYRGDPQVHRYQGWDRTDVDGVREEIQQMLTREPGAPGGWVQLSVEELESDRLVGDVGVSPSDHEPGVVKIGYTMSPAFQGRGYASEAVSALIDYAFDRLGAQIVRAYASAENTPSIRLAERVGMRLVEHVEHRESDKIWHGVRYENRRCPGSGMDEPEGRR
jgi:RimJ/RimL family protein N-acetyltransferase